MTLRPLSTVIVGLTALLTPALALAHGGAGGPPKAIQGMNEGLAAAITALVIFVAVLAILGAKVWPVIGKALDERATKITSEIEAAEAARKQARMALEQYERNLADARAEAQTMLDQARQQQLAQTAALKAQADTELSAMKEKAMREIDAAKRAAIGEIHSHAANLAAAAATKILRREINRDDQQRFVDECLAEMKA